MDAAEIARRVADIKAKIAHESGRLTEHPDDNIASESAEESGDADFSADDSPPIALPL